MEHGPTEVDLWLNDVFANHPAFAAALICRGHTENGARDVRVDALDFDGIAATPRVRWAEEPAQRVASASGGFWRPGT